ncbi:hypothetical protein I546_7118 [Mycobacterium kansasii 732]|nr:hypothetical protein I546_7118 [Mycobacterium kansasii 732]
MTDTTQRATGEGVLLRAIRRLLSFVHRLFGRRTVHAEPEAEGNK